MDFKPYLSASAHHHNCVDEALLQQPTKLVDFLVDDGFVERTRLPLSLEPFMGVYFIRLPTYQCEVTNLSQRDLAYS